MLCEFVSDVKIIFFRTDIYEKTFFKTEQKSDNLYYNVL